jgi:hypothetical protein
VELGIVLLQVLLKEIMVDLVLVHRMELVEVGELVHSQDNPVLLALQQPQTK